MWIFSPRVDALDLEEIVNIKCGFPLYALTRVIYFFCFVFTHRWLRSKPRQVNRWRESPVHFCLKGRICRVDVCECVCMPGLECLSGLALIEADKALRYCGWRGSFRAGERASERESGRENVVTAVPSVPLYIHQSAGHQWLLALFSDSLSPYWLKRTHSSPLLCSRRVARLFSLLISVQYPFFSHQYVPGTVQRQPQVCTSLQTKTSYNYTSSNDKFTPWRYVESGKDAMQDWSYTRYRFAFFPLQNRRVTVFLRASLFELDYPGVQRVSQNYLQKIKNKINKRMTGGNTSIKRCARVDQVRENIEFHWGEKKKKKHVWIRIWAERRFGEKHVAGVKIRHGMAKKQAFYRGD